MYYKGNLFYLDSIKNKEYTICIGKTNYMVLNCSTEGLEKLLKNLSNEEYQTLVAYVCDSIEYNGSEIDIQTFLKKIFQDVKFNTRNNLPSSAIEIIFELIEDENGELYGKEILSGEIFPIATKIEGECQIENCGKTQTLYVNDSKFYSNKPKGEYYLYQNKKTYEYIDCYGIIHKAIYTHEERIFYNVTRNVYRVKGDGGKSFFFVGGQDCYYSKIRLGYRFIHSNVSRGEVYLENLGPANESEIENYQKRYTPKKRFLRGINNEFIAYLSHMAKENVFKGDIISKKEIKKERIALSDEEKLMEDIEFLLVKLKEYNQEEYQKYHKQYEELFSSQQLKINTVTIGYLESLKTNILISLKLEKNQGFSFIEYLNKLKNEYLCYFILSKGEKTTLTIKDIDELMEMFLKTKEDYNPIKRRIIIRNLALLYLFELYENIDAITELDLQDSYINDFLKTILVCLETLKEKDVLDDTFVIHLQEEITLEDVLDIIKNIKFKKHDEEFIKTLSL